MKPINIDPEDVITVKEAAELMETSTRAVRYKLEYGVMPGYKTDSKWIINRKACIFYMNTQKQLKERRKQD